MLTETVDVCVCLCKKIHSETPWNFVHIAINMLSSNSNALYCCRTKALVIFLKENHKY